MRKCDRHVPMIFRATRIYRCEACKIALSNKIIAPRFSRFNSPVDYNRIVPRATTVRGLTLYLSCYLDGTAWRINRITGEIRTANRRKALRKLRLLSSFPSFLRRRESLIDWLTGKRCRVSFSIPERNEKKWNIRTPAYLLVVFSRTGITEILQGDE